MGCKSGRWGWNFDYSKRTSYSKKNKTLNTSKHLTIKLDTEITNLKITANSVGRVAPNTAKISIKNSEKPIDLVSNLDKNETTTIQVIKDK